ncbi:MAG: YkvA family protein [Actinomycetota bacterium]
MSDEILQGEIVNERGETRRRPPATKEERRDRLRHYAVFVPQLVKLVYRLMKDPRVPTRTKATLFVTAGYIVSPIDVVPDWITGVGRFDDLIVAAFALDQILNRVPEHVVLEHWDGDEDVLRIIQEILDISTGFMPASIRKRFINR